MTKKNYPTVGIGEACRLTGVSEKQLRSWEGRYIPDPDRVVCGDRAYRRYTADDIELIKKIHQFQSEGFTLKAAAKKATAANTKGKEN